MVRYGVEFTKEEAEVFEEYIEDVRRGYNWNQSMSRLYKIYLKSSLGPMDAAKELLINLINWEK